eukprot:m.118970 g.118970  ORF g.118970 m.118970 type:complete len:284 (-) comp23154_c0_seq1:1220-2071(-)
MEVLSSFTLALDMSSLCLWRIFSSKPLANLEERCQLQWERAVAHSLTSLPSIEVLAKPHISKTLETSVFTIASRKTVNLKKFREHLLSLGALMASTPLPLDAPLFLEIFLNSLSSKLPPTWTTIGDEENRVFLHANLYESNCNSRLPCVSLEGHSFENHLKFSVSIAQGLLMKVDATDFLISPTATKDFHSLHRTKYVNNEMVCILPALDVGSVYEICDSSHLSEADWQTLRQDWKRVHVLLPAPPPAFYAFVCLSGRSSPVLVPSYLLRRLPQLSLACPCFS